MRVVKIKLETFVYTGSPLENETSQVLLELSVVLAVRIGEAGAEGSVHRLCQQLRVISHEGVMVLWVVHIVQHLHIVVCDAVEKPHLVLLALLVLLLEEPPEGILLPG